MFSKNQHYNVTNETVEKLAINLPLISPYCTWAIQILFNNKDDEVDLTPLKDKVYLHLEAAGSYIDPKKLSGMDKIVAHYKDQLLDGTAALTKMKVRE